MTAPVLDAGPLTLRPFEESDVDFVHGLLNDERVRQYLSKTRPQSGDAVRRFVETEDDLRLVARVDGERVGVVDLVHVDESFGTAELGYFFDPESWGNGYATAAARAVLGHGFDERRLHRVSAQVVDPNSGSRRVLEKLGFRREGIFRDQAFVAGERVDVHWYGLLAEEWRGNGS